MMKEIQIPALTALQSSDATAIRQIVNVLVQEIVDLNKTISAMQSDIGAMRQRRDSYEQMRRR
jgi:predicted  nucleic acid-binding Zn-ribbon protein